MTLATCLLTNTIPAEFLPAEGAFFTQSLQPEQCVWDGACTGGSGLSCTGGSGLSSQHRQTLHSISALSLVSVQQRKVIQANKASWGLASCQNWQMGARTLLWLWSVTSSPLSAWVCSEQISLQKDAVANSELPFQGTWGPLVNSSVKAAHTKESFVSATVPPEPSLLSVRWAWTWQVK